MDRQHELKMSIVDMKPSHNVPPICLHQYVQNIHRDDKDVSQTNEQCSIILKSLFCNSLKNY